MNTENYKNLFGPTFEYFVCEFEALQKIKQNNIEWVIHHSNELLATYKHKGTGINSRVIGDIMRQAEFVEDPLFLKYLAGILVSSYTDSLQSDQGSYYTNLLAQLSNYQIATHGLIYKNLRKAFQDSQTERRNWEITISTEDVLQHLQIETDKSQRGLVKHIFKGLQRLLLIREVKFAKNFMQQGVSLKASGIGVELYLWAQGRGDLARDSLKYLTASSVVLANF